MTYVSRTLAHDPALNMSRMYILKFAQFFQSWDKESVPLKPKGPGPCKFIDKPCDKWSGTEKETIFCFLEVFGDPPPVKVEWFKGFKDLSMEGGRFKAYLDGNNGQAVLGVEGLKQEDEGAYRCVLTDGDGNEIEHEFSIYVTGKL